jgi:hypothetical protein
MTESEALNNLLYWVERAVRKGHANCDIEEAWEEYENSTPDNEKLAGT